MSFLDLSAYEGKHSISSFKWMKSFLTAASWIGESAYSSGRWLWSKVVTVMMFIRFLLSMDFRLFEFLDLSDKVSTDPILAESLSLYFSDWSLSKKSQTSFINFRVSGRLFKDSLPVFILCIMPLVLDWVFLRDMSLVKLVLLPSFDIEESALVKLTLDSFFAKSGGYYSLLLLVGYLLPLLSMALNLYDS